MQSNYQVIVVGAGPAGLATSLCLSANHISHCVVDASKYAVYKAGDALPPNAKPLLKQLGILGLLDHKHHMPYYGNNSIWGSDTWHKEEFIKSLYGHGYLLDRVYFEKQLRQLVCDTNTPFYSGYQLHNVEEKVSEIEATIRSDSECLQLTAQYIVDATGRKASVCRHLGAYKKALDQQLTFSFWHQTKQQIPRQIWIEATENGWWYLSPAANGKVNCMFFTLNGLRPQRNEMAKFLRAELIKTIQIQKIIQPVEEELIDNQCMPSGTSCLEIPYGDHWLAVGDAAFSYDPISSYGITSALASGYYGAHAIASKLSGEEAAFMSYHYILQNGTMPYLQKLTNQYSMEKRWPNSYYWKNRLLSNQK